jgi:hypothetical protein
MRMRGEEKVSRKKVLNRHLSLLAFAFVDANASNENRGWA